MKDDIFVYYRAKVNFRAVKYDFNKWIHKPIRFKDQQCWKLNLTQCMGSMPKTGAWSLEDLKTCFSPVWVSWKVLFLIMLTLSVCIESGQMQEFGHMCELSCACGHVNAQEWLSVHRGDMCFFHNAALNTWVFCHHKAQSRGNVRIREILCNSLGEATYLRKGSEARENRLNNAMSFFKDGPSLPSLCSYFCSFFPPITSSLTCLSICDLP